MNLTTEHITILKQFVGQSHNFQRSIEQRVEAIAQIPPSFIILVDGLAKHNIEHPGNTLLLEEILKDIRLLKTWLRL